MNTSLPDSKTGLRQLEVLAAVDALEHHDVDLVEQGGDRVDDLHAALRGVSSYTPARGSMLALRSSLPTGKRGDDVHARELRDARRTCC